MNVYLVGGAVRDELIGRKIKEKDWVVVGSTEEDLLAKSFKKINSKIDIYHQFISKNHIADLLGVWTVTIAGYSFLIGQINRYSYWSWDGLLEGLIKIFIRTYILIIKKRFCY